MVSNMAYAGVYTGSRLWCLIDQCLYTRPMLAHAFDLIECYRGVARNEREAGTGHPRQGTVILGKLPSHFETLARLPKYEFSTGGVISIVIFTRDRSVTAGVPPRYVSQFLGSFCDANPPCHLSHLETISLNHFDPQNFLAVFSRFSQEAL